MTTGEITLTSNTYRGPRAATVSTSRTGAVGANWSHQPARFGARGTAVPRGDERAAGREPLFLTLLGLAALLLLGLLVVGPSLSWPMILGVGMLSVLALGLAWAFTGPGARRCRD